MRADHTLYIDSLSCSIKGRRILDSVYMEIPVNAVIGLLGRNGSGKSTLLNVIFGNRKPDFAFMTCNGKHFKKGYRTGEIILLAQGRSFPQGMRIREILSLFDLIDDRIHDIDMVKNNFDNRLGNLSGGESRAIETLVTLYAKQSFCLLDEPFAGLSPITVDLIKEHIQLVRKQKGILISDHLYQQVIDISDRFYLLHNSNLLPMNNYQELIHYHYIPVR